MPQLPPWIRAADTPAYYTRGLGLGLQAAQEQNRVNQAQQQMALEAQRAAVNQELARQELALREQETASERELAQAKIEEAARRYSAQQQYQQRVSGGEDPMAVMMELGPQMGSEQTVQAAIVRAQMQEAKDANQIPLGPVQAMPVLDPTTKQPVPGWGAVPGGYGKGQNVIRLAGTQASLTPNELLTEADRIQRDIRTATTGISGNPDLLRETPDPKWKPDSPQLAAWKAGRAQIVALQQERERLRQQAFGKSSSPLAGSLPSTGVDFIWDQKTGTLKKAREQTPTVAGPSPAAWGQSLWDAVRRGRPRSMPTNLPAGSVMLRPG